MNSDELNSIREAEKESHIKAYSENKLFEAGSWLQKPVKTVMDVLTAFEGYSELNVLDLGCGIGRNCIPIAQKFKDISCNIDCVDILDFAIEKLNQNAVDFSVESEINGIISSIDDFKIEENHYDFIIAVSALEHINSAEAFKNKLAEINKGIRKNGVVCMIINSEITEIDKESKKELVPQFEVNLKTETLIEMLKSVFADWKIIKHTVKSRRYDIPRQNHIADLSTDVVTFTAIKN